MRIVALLLLLLPATAGAQTIPGPLSLDRMSFALGGGLVTYDETTGEKLDENAGFNTEGVIAYSFGREWSLNGYFQHDWTNQWSLWRVGPRLLVLGSGTGQRAQLGLGADFVHYPGDDGEELTDQNVSWIAGLYGSWNLSGTPRKPLRWYLVGAGEHDQPNEITTFRLGVRAVFSTAYD